MKKSLKTKAFFFWSGGKDGALSYYRARKDVRVVHLLNMIAEDGGVSRSHGIRTKIMQLQAEAMGVPVIQVRSSWETYEGMTSNEIDSKNGNGEKT